MKRGVLFSLVATLLSSICLAGFKPKTIKPKKPAQFQAHVTQAGVTYAADLLVQDKEQKDFFYKELISSNIVAVRLAVFNGGTGEVALPVEEIRLFGPDGAEIPAVGPEAVAEAVLEDRVVTPQMKEKNPPVAVAPNTRTGDPRYDRTDPRYDPRLDPSDPSYDPRDPRNRGYGNDPYGRGWGRPGVDVVLNPGGGDHGPAGEISQYEKQLVEKDFSDKAHMSEVVLPSFSRDRFLYFSVQEKPVTAKGFVLRLPPGKGRPTDVVLRF